MHIVFDMDNTLVDEFGASMREGMREVLEELQTKEHQLTLWTSSTRARAQIILEDHNLKKYFSKFVYREDYDKENKGVAKKIETINADFLIDDDPSQVDYALSMGKKTFLIAAYRQGAKMDKKELQKLLKAIEKAKGFFGRLFNNH